MLCCWICGAVTHLIEQCDVCIVVQQHFHAFEMSSLCGLMQSCVAVIIRSLHPTIFFKACAGFLKFTTLLSFITDYISSEEAIQCLLGFSSVIIGNDFLKIY